MGRARVRSRWGRVNLLLIAACAALFVFLLGFWFVRQLTWSHAQLTYTPDPSNANVRTAEEVAEDTSSRGPYQVARWREIRAKGEEWVRDGLYVALNQAGAKLAQGTYRDGKRQGAWTYWRDDGSVDRTRSGTYDNDVLIEPALSPRGDFGDAEVR